MQTTSFSFTTTMPLSVEAWRVMAGSRACEDCRTPIGLFDVAAEEDDEGYPTGPVTGERRWLEMVDPPSFGVEHTPERCREARG